MAVDEDRVDRLGIMVSAIMDAINSVPPDDRRVILAAALATVIHDVHKEYGSSKETLMRSFIKSVAVGDAAIEDPSEGEGWQNN